VILRPYGGACNPYKGIGCPGLKKMGVKISEVLNIFINILSIYKIRVKKRNKSILDFKYRRFFHDIQTLYKI